MPAPVCRSPGPIAAAALWRLPRAAAAAMLAVATACVGQPPLEPARRELRVVLRSDPRTFNPVGAVDAVSASLIALMHAPLFRVDARTQEVVPALATGFASAGDDAAITVTLRRDVRFPDGEPFGAADVVFSLAVFQDPGLGAPQLQALRLGGQPARATVVDDLTVRIEFGGVPAEPARLLTGVPMLPRHRLEPAYREGRLADLWSVGEPPEAILGLGPYRLEGYEQGRGVTFAANPAYWRRNEAGAPLPGIARLTVTIISDPDAQVARLLAGDLDLLSAIDTRSYDTIAADAEGAGVVLRDLGPSLEYAFVVLNLDDGPPARPLPRTRWFHDATVRHAISTAIDRAAIAHLVYDGRATPLGSHVSPGNRRWHAASPPPSAAPDVARRRLAAAGYRWDPRGRLRDPQGTPVSFSLLTSTSNPQRQRMAAVIESDLAAIGIEARITALEFRAYVDRLTRTRDFDAAIMALGGGDTDPNAEAGVWHLDGPTHLWRLRAPAPMAPWEGEIDRLMRAQAIAPSLEERRTLYARLQGLVTEHLPIIPLVSPNHLVVVRRGLRGVVPDVTSRDSLWNIDEFSWNAVERP